jgi:hypothetical protein
MFEFDDAVYKSRLYNGQAADPSVPQFKRNGCNRRETLFLDTAARGIERLPEEIQNQAPLSLSQENHA